jgi:hypothetical protein
LLLARTSQIARGMFHDLPNAIRRLSVVREDDDLRDKTYGPNLNAKKSGTTTESLTASRAQSSANRDDSPIERSSRPIEQSFEV